MKNMNLLVATVLLVGLSGCAHKLMQGSVAMKTSENEAHVCIGKGQVAVGDRVTLYKNVCSNKLGSSRVGGGSCEKKEAGKGSVQEILNEHYSVVRFDPGVQFEEGSFVETL